MTEKKPITIQEELIKEMLPELYEFIRAKEEIFGRNPYINLDKASLKRQSPFLKEEVVVVPIEGSRGVLGKIVPSLQTGSITFTQESARGSAYMTYDACCNAGTEFTDDPAKGPVHPDNDNFQNWTRNKFCITKYEKLGFVQREIASASYRSEGYLLREEKKHDEDPFWTNSEEALQRRTEIRTGLLSALKENFG